jgi:hypothetical protein
MKTGITYALATGLILLGAQTALADPMRCTGEEKTCNSNCIKFARATISNCLELCRASRQICLRTGCWDNGTSRYCGLLKQ